ncbi:MAG: hypothetical protein NTY23_07715 [Chloroflexi bacterium]|nr:hypothetical protein [Chloroflexota bacterium]
MKRRGRNALVVLLVLAAGILLGPFAVPVPELQGTVPPQLLAEADVAS